MPFFDAMGASSSGLTAQRTRMNVISSNIANINTTRTPEGGPYRRKDTMFAALPSAKSFQDELIALEKNKDDPMHVKVVGIVEDSRPPTMKYDPNHPDANEEGYVAMPNVKLPIEMMNLGVATRTYQANAAILKRYQAFLLICQTP